MKKIKEIIKHIEDFDEEFGLTDVILMSDTKIRRLEIREDEIRYIG